MCDVTLTAGSLFLRRDVVIVEVWAKQRTTCAHPACTEFAATAPPQLHSTCQATQQHSKSPWPCRTIGVHLLDEDLRIEPLPFLSIFKNTFIFASWAW